MLKKINIILAILTFLAVSIGGGIYFWSDWENQQPGMLTGQIFNEPKPAVSSSEDSGNVEPSSNESPANLSRLKEKLKIALGGEAGMVLQSAQEGQSDRDIFAGNSSFQNQGKEDFSFAVVADAEDYSSSGYNPELEGILAKVKEKNPDLVFFSGDLITTSAKTLAENRQRVINLKSLIAKYIAQKFYIVFGQHDIECGQDCVDAWQEIFFGKKYQPGEKRVLQYAFDYGKTHFVLLSADYPLKHGVDDEQLAWLEQDLAQTKQPNKIVFSHVPPVSFFKESAKDCHDMSCLPTQQAKLQKILEKYKVDLVVSGHEHVFDHKIVNEIDYLLGGNSGNGPRYKGTIKGDSYSLFTVKGEKISVKALTPGDKVIREIEIK